MPTLEQIWPPLDWHSYEANNTLSLTTPRQECPAMCSDLLLYPCTAPHTNMNICLRQPGFLSVCSSAKRNLSLNFDYCSSASSRLDQSPRLASLGGDFSLPAGELRPWISQRALQSRLARYPLSPLHGVLRQVSREPSDCDILESVEGELANNDLSHKIASRGKNEGGFLASRAGKRAIRGNSNIQILRTN